MSAPATDAPGSATHHVGHRIAIASVAVLCVLALAASTTSTARAQSVPPACTGIVAQDAALATCGVVLGVTPTTITWTREATLIATALAVPRLAFRGPAPSEGARPIDAVTVWQTNGWQSWSALGTGPFDTLKTFETGQTYVLVARASLDLSLASPAAPSPAAPIVGPIAAPTTSVFAGARIVSLYGFPGVPMMGALGTYATAEDAAVAVDTLAREYATLSGDTRVIPALHLIVAVAQADAGWDGTYLGRMPIETIRIYVEMTRAHGQLLFVDVQVGWSDPLVEVQLLEPLLREPHVHVALDPEFATKGKNWAPGEAIGHLVPEQVNAVQRYLAALSARESIPPKVLVLHQFRADMLHEPERIEQIDGVDLVVDMDGWGPPGQKLDGYAAFARTAYSEYAGFKLFYHWDQPLLTPAEVMALPHPPDYLIYQ